MQPKAKICLALDVDELERVSFFVNELRDVVDVFKVGLQLYCKYGNSVIKQIKKYDSKIFLDLKFLDIPNTVANACRVVTSLGVDIINVHALGGLDMMRAASEAAQEESRKLGIEKPQVIGVTILTSIDDKILNEEIKISGNVESQVIHLARLAQKSGLDGVVASPLETKQIRKTCGENFLIVTPGIRPSFSQKDDQKRTLTPAEAVLSGSNILVIGRPIYAALNPRQIVDSLREEINNVQTN